MWNRRSQLRNVPVLFIAGGADRRMPPGVAMRLYDANQSPLKQILVVPGASHGEAFSADRKLYLDTVFKFWSRLRIRGGKRISADTRITRIWMPANQLKDAAMRIRNQRNLFSIGPKPK
jgi:hypothetical protein